MDLENMLDMLETEANNTGQVNLNSYEETEAYEVENFLVKQGQPRRAAKQMSRVAVKNPNFKMPLLTSARANNGQGIQSIKGSAMTPKSAAQFDINVRRDTATIAGVALPLAIFGYQDVANGYRSILVLPTGTVLTRVQYGEVNTLPTSLVLTYTNGANVDTVTITCNQYPYPSFLNAMATDMFKMSKIRYSLSDATQLTQFNQAFEFVTRSMFGKKGSDSVSVGAYKNPNQFQNGIIDIDGVFDLDSETAITTNIIAVAGFSFTISAFVEKFYRQNSKGF